MHLGGRSFSSDIRRQAKSDFKVPENSGSLPGSAFSRAASWSR